MGVPQNILYKLIQCLATKLVCLCTQEFYNQAQHNKSIKYALKHIRLINTINIILKTSISGLELIQIL
jgi:hypothetical protein